MALTQEEIYEKVRAVIVGALGVDEEEVTPTAKLEEDLGAESIDYLDIGFRLEKSFGIKIGEKELQIPDSILNDTNYVLDGKVTDLGMSELKQKLGFMNLDEFDKNRNVADFMKFFTVNDIVSFVKTKLV
jgi:acyl carrier protein